MIKIKSFPDIKLIIGGVFYFLKEDINYVNESLLKDFESLSLNDETLEKYNNYLFGVIKKFEKLFGLDDKKVLKR